MNISKSIEELENDIWEETNFPTPLVEKCYKYRKIPVKDLTIEQTRLLVNQSIGLNFLIPKAIGILKENIFAEGDFFEGDLLSAVLHAEKSYWAKDQTNKKELINLLLDKSFKLKENISPINSNRELLKQIEMFITS